MGLILKHVVTTQAGTKHYRRRLPKDVAERVGKGEFKRLLGENDREALKAYPRVHAEFERLVATARSSRSQGGTSVPETLTPLEIYRQAQSLSRELAAQAVTIGGRTVLVGEDAEAADIIRESYLSRLPFDTETGNPIGGNAVEGLALGMLSGEHHRPTPTLEDARKLYLKDRVGDDVGKQLQLDLVFRLIQEALQSDRTLASLRREDAREVRDHMLEGRRPSSVDRYLNVVRAVLNHAIREFDLAGVVNPFMHLEAAPRERAEPDRVKRRPFTKKELEATTARIRSHASPALILIWQMLEGTGCRLAEVTGLRVADTRLDHAIPHISVEWHEQRRIKTHASRRDVPLLGSALQAAKAAVKAAKDGEMLFPRYGRPGGADSASAALGKHVRAVVSDPKVTTHSLRHLMKDRLRFAGVQKSEQNMVLGHSGGGVGEDYGGEEVRLMVAERALRAALDRT